MYFRSPLSRRERKRDASGDGAKAEPCGTGALDSFSLYMPAVSTLPGGALEDTGTYLRDRYQTTHVGMCIAVCSLEADRVNKNSSPLRGKGSGMREIEREVGTGVVDLERSIGCALRTVFWILFVLYTAVLAVLGWALYTSVLAHHRIPLPDSSKDAVIVGLSVVVLGTILAAMTRDQLLHIIFHRVRRQRSN